MMRALWPLALLLAGCNVLLPLEPPGRDDARPPDAPPGQEAAAWRDLGRDGPQDLPAPPDAARDASDGAGPPDQSQPPDNKLLPDKKQLTKEAGVIKADKGPILCSALTCPAGCCNGFGVCVPYVQQIDTVCGTAGQPCKACPSGDVCGIAGSCVPATSSCSTSCSGCCDVTGNCITDGAGNSQACGVGGAACADCAASGLYCNAGTCLAPPCGPCTGCCALPNKCLSYTQQTASQCGRFGAPCKVCGSGSCCGGICSLFPCP